VDQSIQDRIGQGWVAQVLMPGYVPMPVPCRADPTRSVPGLVDAAWCISKVDGATDMFMLQLRCGAWWFWRRHLQQADDRSIAAGTQRLSACASGFQRDLTVVAGQAQRSSSSTDNSTSDLSCGLRTRAGTTAQS